jgi:hypothetical protein
MIDNLSDDDLIYAIEVTSWDLTRRPDRLAEKMDMIVDIKSLRRQIQEDTENTYVSKMKIKAGWLRQYIEERER